MLRAITLAAMLALAPAAAYADSHETTEGEGTTTEGGGEATTEGGTTAAPAADTGGGGGDGVATKGTMGLHFAVPSGGGPTFGMTYFLNPMAALVIDFGLALRSTAGAPMMDRANTGGFSLEAGWRKHRKIVGKLSAYMQPSLFFSKTPGISFGDALSLGLTFGLGAEYWFTNQWTLSGHTGVALLFANSTMDPGSLKDISFTTGTSALFVNFYWW